MAKNSDEVSNLRHPLRVLITAGPTHEPIDAVRYIANRSSGRMGLALAEAALKRGFPTTLALGPTSLGPPENSHLRLVRFQTAAQLEQLLKELWPSHDVLLMAAAVADYRLAVESGVSASDRGSKKLNRSGDGLRLDLEATPDLLMGLAAMTRSDQIVIGFALESAEGLIDSAKRKLSEKSLSAIVANPLETMDSHEITATVLVRGGQALRPPPNMLKGDFAQWLLDSLPRVHALAAKSG
ncbi:MAG: phosphopantothenoylcysteine decarboxylase [Phycisphaerales bacterium]|nr:phosphopantothenoylcysteine decarboxylase [Terriglobales bacterium]MCI0631135.1 phosphopantothenoylcysteine decarboxylase [Phycisphaerales bacterium]MCI0677192.1 phosphopantothenoylcysteine decarboxylase [Phycisphaerales bacterium]